ncbi:aldehyde dehydrogenase family protein [Desulfovirgula thermocuniculi]|uniref:aldehyde dehydrogenase family protein n=1 Tax=Desulfovirgula thermocuniculi TaxID=348842 RepID=UPI00040D1591|nr:aldehyde dehydrogenase [Desulfovirgula thermocuniculi]
MALEILEVTDKYTGAVVERLPLDTREDLREKIERAYLAKESIRQTSLAWRKDLVRRVGERIAQEREYFAELLIKQAGQPRKFAQWEVERTVSLARHFDQILDLIAPREIPAAQGKNILMREPYGVVAVITPRNTPLVVPFYTAFSALGAGNAVIQKPSALTPGPTRRLVELVREEGCPPDAVQFSTCPGEKAAAEFVENPLVDVFITYSNSSVGKDAVVKMGRYLAGTRHVESGLPVIAGKMTKFVPELAGNDPFIVLEGADLEKAVEAAVLGGYGNAGQLCISAKRFIVAREVAGDFRSRLVEAIGRLKVGDPADPETDIGPLARREALELALKGLRAAEEEGGKVLVGGRVEGPFFYPTLVEFPKEVLLHGNSRPLLWREESFAPVRSLVVFDTPEEAVRLANDTSYGLGAAVFGPTEAALEIARQLRAGRIIINESPLYGDVHLPVGGVGDSGLYGATHKIEEVTYVKRIHLS